MKFSSFTDYSLRVLIYLGVQQDRLATVSEIAGVFDISENHLTKVVHFLGRCGYAETVRGKGGGMRLALAPEDIRLGDVIRQTETDFDLVECFAPESNCRIGSACVLQGILKQGLDAMFGVLDGYTLADLLQRPKTLARLVRWDGDAAKA
jgi:Rrf2 family nitric oxide-sensitive transcriptional repressor